MKKKRAVDGGAGVVEVRHRKTAGGGGWWPFF